MTVANVKIAQVLLKRGNTARSLTYTGPIGEVTIDTDLQSLRIHDGITAGGHIVQGGGGGGSVDLSGYASIPQLTANISTVNSKIAGANAAIVTANTALKSYVDAQVATKTTTTYVDSAISTAVNNLINSAPGTLDTLGEISANLANEANAIGAITNSITSTNANVVAANVQIASLWANASAQSNSLAGANAAIVTANTAMKGYVDAVTTAWTANAATQQGSIATLQANAGVQADAIATLQSNAATQQTAINTLQANVGGFYTWANTNFGTSSYANANVASYLPSYSGNITAGNATIGTYAPGNYGLRITGSSVAVGMFNTSSLTVDSSGNLLLGGTGHVRITGASGSTVTIGGGSSGNVYVPGGIVFNDGSKQTTAYTGYSDTNVASYISGNVTTGNLTVSHDAVVLGNLRVAGTQTAVNTAHLNISDLFITVANGAVQASDANGAGIRVAGALANISYSSTSDSFVFNKPITANIVNNGYTWTFDENGILTYPGSSFTETSSGYWSAYADPTTHSGIEVISGDATNVFNTGAVVLTSAVGTGYKSWVFGVDGSLTFPDSTVQTTAYTGPTYGNTQVAAYLPVFGGNISANIVRPGGSASGQNENPTSNNVFWSYVAQDTNTEQVAVGWTAEVVGGGTYTVTNVEVNGPFRYITLNDEGLTLSYRCRIDFSTPAQAWLFSESGNLTLPANMDFMSSPAISGTGIVFGDGTYQYTAAGDPGKLTNDGHEVVLNGNGELIIENTVRTKPGYYYVATSDTSTEMSWSNSVQAPSTGVYSGMGSGPDGVWIENQSTDSEGNWVDKTWSFGMDGNLTLPGSQSPLVDGGYIFNVKGIVGLTASSGARITGFNTVSAQNFTFANGVNILSTVSGGSGLGDKIILKNNNYALDFGVSDNNNLGGPNNSDYRGERIVLWDNAGAYNGEWHYAMGMEDNHMWFGIDEYNNSGWGYKWYGRGVEVLKLDSAGTITLGATSGGIFWSNGDPYSTGTTTSTLPVIVGNTASGSEGSLWFNTDDGRLYVDVNINGTPIWVDASPATIPAPSTYLGDLEIEGNVITFPAGTLTIDGTGNLLVNGNLVTGSGGSSSTVDLSNIQGNVVVNQEGAGFVVDAGGDRRVGFMKYQGFEGSFVHANGLTKSIPFRIGRVSTDDITLANVDVFTTEVYVGTNGHVRIGDDNSNTISDPVSRLQVVGNVYASSDITTAGKLSVVNGNPSDPTAILTQGLDYNFQLTAQNGVGNNTGDEVARFGLNYASEGWNTFTQYVRGGSAQDGHQVLWAGNVAMLHVNSDGIEVDGDIRGNIVLPVNGTIKNHDGSTYGSTGSSYGDSNVLSLLAGFSQGEANYGFGDNCTLTLPNTFLLSSFGGDAVVSTVNSLTLGAHNNVTISTADNNYQWIFGSDGSTTFPDHQPVSITGNLTVGNLFVNGTTTTIDTASYSVEDNIIQIAANNPADTLDIGFVGHRTVDGTLQHTGLVRNASIGKWILFSNVVPQPGTTVDFTNAIPDDLITGTIQATDFTFANGASLSSTLSLSSNVAATAHLSILAGAPTNAGGSAGDYMKELRVDDNYLYVSNGNYGGTTYTSSGSFVQMIYTNEFGAGHNGYHFQSVPSGEWINIRNAVSWAMRDSANTLTSLTYVSDNGNGLFSFDGGSYMTPAGSATLYYTVSGSNIWKTVPLSTFQSPAFGNANVAAYLTANPQAGTYSNANVSTYLTAGVSGNIKTSANVIAPNFLFANGVNILSTVGSSYGNTQVAAYLPTYAGNIGAANIVTTGATSGNISGANVISANTFQVSNGIFWANGTAWSSTSGGGTNYTNANVSSFLASFGSNVIVTTGNITAGNLIGTQYGNTIGTTAIYSGNVTAANIIANQFGNTIGTTATYSGNVTAANIVTTGTYGNITNANVIFANTVVVGGVSLTRATNGYNNWKGNTYANIDNISCSVYSNGAVAFSSVSGTLNYYWSSITNLTAGKFFGNTSTGGAAVTTPVIISSAATITSGGDTVQLTLQDQDLKRIYNVTYVQTVSSSNCAIVAERVL